MSDQQVDDFIEHFGIKGMRWGIRNQHQLDRVPRVARGTAARRQHRKEVAKRVAVVGGAVGVTAVVSALLARRGMISITKAKQMGNSQTAKALLDVHKHVKMRSIHNAELARELKTFASKF